MSNDTFLLEQDIKKLKRKNKTVSSNSTLNSHTASATPLTTEKVDLIGMVNEVNALVANAKKNNWINVKDFGAIGDGIHNDTVAIQSAINSINPLIGGTVYLPSGIYRTSTSIKATSKLTLTGDGTGKTIIRAYFSQCAIIDRDTTVYNYANPLVDFELSNMTLDCTNMVDTTYNISSKGVFIQYMKRNLYKNLHILNAPATGLGTDYMVDSVIDNVIAENCGRQFVALGGAIGSNGIGIGTGKYVDETCLITNCHAINCGNNGIMFEHQGLPPDGIDVNSAYMQVINSTARGCKVGFRSSGDYKVKFIGCSSMKNTTAGVILTIGLSDLGGKDYIISDCHICDNLVQGIYIANAQGDTSILIDNNIINGNLNDGIRLSVPQTTYNCTISNNSISKNGGRGIRAEFATSNLKIIGNQIYNNYYSGVTISDCLNYVEVSGNHIFNNGTSNNAVSKWGIEVTSVSATSGLSIKNNITFDNQTTKTQDKGINILGAGTITNSIVEGNDVRSNKTGTFSTVASASLIVRNNLGYNPIGLSSITVTASPFTYTAGNSAETVYINSGTVSSITKSGITIGSSTGTNIELQPNESIIVTYSVLPTIVADKH